LALYAVVKILLKNYWSRITTKMAWFVASETSHP